MFSRANSVKTRSAGRATAARMTATCTSLAKQRFGQPGRAVRVQIERYRGMTLGVGAQRARHAGMQRRRSRQPDRDPAALAHGRRARPHGGALDPAQQRARFLQKSFAGRRELHAARQAGEQFGAELLLQRVDLLTERRLLQAEPGRRARDVPLFGDGEEIAEMTQFHGQTPYVIDMDYAITIYFTIVLPPD